ncbi:MAG: hypothetical protein KAJ23_08355 [Maribacter sp.]|nr:hypothetical protein [Maribacter sp.]
MNLNRVQQWGMEVRPDWDPFVVEHFILGISNWVPRDFNFVINNHYFNGLVAVGRAQRRYYGEKYQIALKETSKVLQLIKDELGEERVKE